MSQRDDIEAVLRAWDRYEVARGAPPVIDYDCYPTERQVQAAESRLAVYERLSELARDVAPESGLAGRLRAHLAYLRALMGEQIQLNDYVRATQGCPATGWSEAYVTERGEVARKMLDALGVCWGRDTEADLQEFGRPLDAESAVEAIRSAAEKFAPAVRHASGATAPYNLTVTTTEVDAYWAYWLDGAGQDVRLRLNRRNARFTELRARQFALHEVLGHGLQSASLAARCADEDVPWVRLMSVHAPHQVLFEGLAEALPLFIAPDDEALAASVRLDHYLHLVRAELHLAINAGASLDDCVRHARARVPFWRDENIVNILADRSNDRLLRSYLWSYPAGADWFIALSEADPTTIRKVLHAAYRDPLTPDDLTKLWPQGPPIGGPGQPVRIRQPPLP